MLSSQVATAYQQSATGSSAETAVYICIFLVSGDVDVTASITGYEAIPRTLLR
jgi:hypothetical protein